ncbi:protein of unknown function [Lactobacillus delbrueckii subsp. delbrueckii]|uniref:Uncharacterized protein n=1 Tax=Lactobacillus delbrueckii subsp. delbrueckii TaxID=83684 RepID=A0AAU9R202_9LACO|nr:protein of unknown function [Lactobacillus delbrueckii subsp. delbrueckii]
MPGTKNMGIYAKVTKKGASKKVTTTKYFKYSKIQSKASKKTKKGKHSGLQRSPEEGQPRPGRQAGPAGRPALRRPAAGLELRHGYL